MFIILDLITRALIFTAFIIGLVTFIKDVKSGALKDFFGDDNDD